jgi:DNA-binding NtrC family response regulator
VTATASKAAAKSTIKILYGECDDTFQASHADAMKKAGHQVTAASSRKAVQDELKRDAFDLVILGSSMSKDDRHHLPYMVKKAHAGTKVLVMHAGTHHHEVDATIDSGVSMILLLERIAALMAPAISR